MSPPAISEQTVANGGSLPCANASAAKSTTSAGAMQAGTASAYTNAGSSQLRGPGAGTLAAITNVVIKSSTHQVTIGSAQAEASYACQKDTLLSANSSSVSNVTVDGRPVTVENGTAAERFPIGSDGSYLQVNRVIRGTTSLTRDAAFVHLVGTGDFTIAETSVSHVDNPCAKAHGYPAAVAPCAPGTDYSPTALECEITAFTRSPIVIGAPFTGPTGATLVAFGHARSTIKSKCLRHRGASYAMLASPSGGGLVTGTRKGDRIIAFGGNYRIEGDGGKDCINMGSGNDVIHDRSANVRVLGGAGAGKIKLGNGDNTIFGGPGALQIKLGNGKNHVHTGPGGGSIKAGNGNNVISAAPGVLQIRLGNGNNHIKGSPGFEKITVGNGNNTIIGAPGVDFISAGTGANTIVGGAGFDQIIARGSRARVTCKVGAAKVSLKGAAVGYATSHGCKHVTTI